jgi:hypothetical protein
MAGKNLRVRVARCNSLSRHLAADFYKPSHRAGELLCPRFNNSAERRLTPFVRGSLAWPQLGYEGQGDSCSSSSATPFGQSTLTRAPRNGTRLGDGTKASHAARCAAFTTIQPSTCEEPCFDSLATLLPKKMTTSTPTSPERMPTMKATTIEMPRYDWRVFVFLALIAALVAML